MIYTEESYKIIGAAMEVHKTLGQGFTEFVYQDALSLEFVKRAIPFEKEKHLTVFYKGEALAHDYFADFVCYDKIIVETKSVATLLPEHKAQVINYLKATGYELGLLINFGENTLVSQRYLNTKHSPINLSD
jgi:GxxExxY protein